MTTRRRATDDLGVQDDQRHPFSLLYHAVYDGYGAEMGPYGLAVYWALKRHADNQAGTCYLKHQTIATETGMSVAKVKSTLAHLVTLGLLQIITRRPHVNIYRLLAVRPRQVNSQEVAINSSEVAINSSEVAIELDSSLDSLNDTHPTTSPPTPPPGEEETVVAVVAVEDRLAHDEERRAADGTPIPFDRFWEAYPKHVDIDDARAAWDALAPGEDRAAQMLDALDRQRPRWAQHSYRYVPKPAKWLRDRQWLNPDPDQAHRPRDDDPPEPPRCQAGDGHSCREAPGMLSRRLCDTHARQSIRQEAESLLGHLRERSWDLEVRLRDELARAHNGQAARFLAGIDWTQAHTVDSLVAALVTLQAQVMAEAQAAAPH